MKPSVHIAVMVGEVCDMLDARRGGVFLDCTLGGAGHTRAILEAHPSNRVVAIDRDARAIARARDTLSDVINRVELHHAMFSDLLRILAGKRFDGILVDCGISTDQLREGRGFSFFDVSALDMRMDESQSLNAHDLVNNASPGELQRVLRRGGVGPEARAIVRAIVDSRPIDTTRELAEVIVRAARGRARNEKIHPATVVFQALRIAVNSEFEELRSLLDAVPKLMRAGGRFVSITFHSLEEKLVANTLREWEHGAARPAHWAGTLEHKPHFGELITRKAIVPSETEVEKNPSARSARLRAFEFGNDESKAALTSKEAVRMTKALGQKGVKSKNLRTRRG